MSERLIRVLLAAILLSAVLPASALDMSEIETGVVRVINVQNGSPVGTGTAFAISGKHLLTNDHVVIGADRLVIASPQFDKAVEVRLVDTNRDYDIAVLRVDDRTLDPLTLATPTPEPGSAVFAIGYPGLADVRGVKLDDPPTVTGGVFSREYRQPWGYRDREIVSLQHNADISGGNSGGPLIDACNRVIGINTQGITQVAQGLFWASAMRYGLEVLRDNGIKVEPESEACDTTGAGALDEVRKAQEAARSAADAAARDSQALRGTVLRWGGIVLAGVLAALVVTFLITSAMVRRQNENLRQAMQRVAEPVSRPFRRGGGDHRTRPADDRAAAENRTRPAKWRGEGLMLTGIGPDGRPLRIELDAAALASASDGHCIGRHPELVDTVIPDDGVSRRHVRITAADGSIRVEDLHSTGGTTVNRQPIDPFVPTSLKAGDKVTLGGVELVVSAL